MSKNVLLRLLGSSVVVFSLFLIASSASAATYWVSNGTGSVPAGNDANSCLQAQNISTPKRNIMGASGGLACLTAGNGDRLEIRAGSYNEIIDTNQQAMPSGTSYSNAATITAFAGETVTIKAIGLAGSQYMIFDGGTGATPRFIVDGTGTSGESLIWVGEGANHIRFLNVEGKNNSQGQIVQINRNASFIEFIGGSYHDAIGNINVYPPGGYGMYVSGKDSLIDGVKIYNCIGFGIHMYSAYGAGFQPDRNTVRNSEIYGITTGSGYSYGTGMLLSGGDSIQVYNNIIHDNQTGDGIALGYGATNARVYNNTITENLTGINYFQTDSAAIKNNIVWNNTAGQIVDSGSNSNPTLSTNLQTDPSFVNAAGGDFHLTSGSSAINQGATLGSPYNVDKDGVTRPVGSAYDIGAYEFGGSVSPTPTPVPPPAGGCTNLWNSTLAVPASFGASFNLFSTAKELLMNVLCSSSSSASLNVGNSTQTEYIYKTGYTWTNNQWTPFNYSGQTMDSTGNWFIGSANASLSSIDLTQKQSVLAYICEWTGVWKCGCNDSSCATSYWNLQQFKQ